MDAGERARRREEVRAEWRERKASSLRIEGDEEAAIEVLAGRCACTCGTPVTTGNVRTFYVDAKHRARRHRRRLETLAKAAGVLPRLNMGTVQSQVRRGERARNAPAPARRRQSRSRQGVSVYFPSVRDLERLEVSVAAAVATEAIDGHDVVIAMEAIAKALKRRRDRG